MTNIDNTFGAIRCLSTSNSTWFKKSQDSLGELIQALQEHLDNIEYVIKDVGRSDCDISDLENIYSLRLDIYEEIVNLMAKINESSSKELEIQKKMYEKEFQKYKNIFEVPKHTDPESQI